MNSDGLFEAKKAVAERECIKDKNIKYSIGFWERDSNASHGLAATEIIDWATPREFDAVIWTNLKFGFRNSRDSMPTKAQVLARYRFKSSISYSSKRFANR